MDPLHILSTDQCLTVEKILHHNTCTLPISIMEHLQTRVFNIRVLVQNQIQPKDRILLLFNFLLLSSFQGTIKNTEYVPVCILTMKHWLKQLKNMYKVLKNRSIPCFIYTKTAFRPEGSFFKSFLIGHFHHYI